MLGYWRCRRGSHGHSLATVSYCIYGPREVVSSPFQSPFKVLHPLDFTAPCRIRFFFLNVALHSPYSVCVKQLIASSRCHSGHIRGWKTDAKKQATAAAQSIMRKGAYMAISRGSGLFSSFMGGGGNSNSKAANDQNHDFDGSGTADGLGMTEIQPHQSFSEERL